MKTKWHHHQFIIHHYDQLDSTNDLALSLAKNNQINHNEIILADRQNSGKGRMGRNWVSPIGNLYFSIILKPQKPINQSSQISFLAAVAVGLAIEDFGAAQKINYKWPNDILINGHKIAGILLESDFQNNSIILGIGINLFSHPQNTLHLASNLKEQGLVIKNKEDLLKKLLDNFAILYQKWLDFGFAPIRNLWLEKAFKLNQKITVNLPDESLEGIFVNLNEEGNLLLENDGKIKIISSGEVFFANNKF